jgi:DNA-binding beta-propeller fold protein YncE
VAPSLIRRAKRARGTTVAATDIGIVGITHSTIPAPIIRGTELQEISTMGNGRQARQGSPRGAAGSFPLFALALLAFPAADAIAAPLLRSRLAIWGYANGAQFRQPRGVAFDPIDGAIYVSNTGEQRIEVFSRTGRPLSRFVHRVRGASGETVDGSPTALAFDRSGHLLVVDPRAAYVDVLDRRGRSVARLDIPAGRPSAVAVAASGTIYVGTTGEASRVHRFRPDYAPDGAWGVEGTAPGCLTDVAAIAALGDTAVAVACERSDLVIQIFSLEGEFRRGFGTHEVGDGNFSLPSAMAATPDGRLWVLDGIRRTLQVFDAQGSLLAVARGSGTALGNFDHPSGLASDGHGSLAVTDRAIGRVQVFEIDDRREGGPSAQQQQP